LLRRFRRIEITPAVGEASKMEWGSKVIQAEFSGVTVNLVHQQFEGLATLKQLQEQIPQGSTTEDFPMTLREIYLAVARVRTN
jgi:hypothetical protein